MNEFPYMPLWINDIDGDEKTETMSTLAFGAYHRLLYKAWHQKPVGSIPDDDAILAQWSRVASSVWTDIRDSVLACWKLKKDGRWHQKRMQQEYQSIVERSRNDSERGRKAAVAKWQRHRELDAHASSKHCLSDANSESESKPNKRKKIPLPADAGPPAEFRQLTDFWISEYASRHPAPWGDFNGFDGKTIADLWRKVTHDLPRAKRVIVAYFSDKTPIYEGHPINLFKRDMQKFITRAGGKETQDAKPNTDSITIPTRRPDGKAGTDQTAAA